MTSSATAAAIGVCCDSATCFSNSTHFPREDAQAVFTYLVTTPPTFYSSALPWFSLRTHCTGRRAPLGDCCACVCGGLGGLADGLSVPQHHTLSSALGSQASQLPQREPQTPATLSKSFLKTCCPARDALPY